jgi:hypothetical protein
LVEDVPGPAPPRKEAATPTSPGEQKPRSPLGQDGPRDAGAQDAATDGPEPADARPDGRRTRDAGSERSQPLASTSRETEGGSGSGGVKDTLSLVGGLRRAVKSKPNVALVFWFSTVREHPLGPLVGSLLGCNPQWRDFLGDLIDPLQDLDGVMLVGPRMADTSKLTILVQSRMDDDKLQKVMGFVGATAQKSGGGVFDGGSGLAAVRFHADRADRIAFTHPRRMIIITPPEGFEQLRNQHEPMSLPAGRGQAMSLTMVTPWRPLRAVGMRLPETLSEIRVNVFGATNGGVNVEIEFDDLDAATAAAHAAEVTAQARAVGGPLLSDIEFVAESNRLAAKTHLSRITSAIALGFIRASICPTTPFDAGRGPR